MYKYSRVARGQTKLLGVVLGLWCCHTHTNFEISLYMLFQVRYAFLKVPRLQLPNEQVNFGADSYVGVFPIQSEHALQSEQSLVHDFVDQRTSAGPRCWRQSGSPAGMLGSSPAALLQEYNPFLLHVVVQSGLQSSFPPILMQL